MTHEQIINKIFNHAHKKELTDYRIAQVSGLHQSTVSRIKEGAEVKLSTLILLADAVELSVFLDIKKQECKTGKHKYP
jgi:hypothetical protein